jgi:WD40 repeat protein
MAVGKRRKFLISTKGGFMISERNKKPRRMFRRPSGRTIIILIAILIPLAIIASYVDFPATIAFVQHYFAPHNNFTYHGHTNYVGGVAWSPDGKRIASASGDDTVQVWDAFTGGHVLTYRGHSSDVVTVAWSPDGKYLASGSVDTTVQVWNATTGQHIFTYRGHTDTVFAVAWSPDGKRVASASNDGTVQEWEASTGKRIVTYSSQTTAKGVPAPWNTVAWSPDGKRIAVGGNGDVQIWNAATGGNVAYYGYHGGTVHEVAWSADGKYIASATSNIVQLWDIATGKNVYTYYGHSAEVFAVAWSPNGKRVASGDGDGLVLVWDALSGGHTYTYRGHADYYPGHNTSGTNAAINSVAWSPDGKHIASASSDSTVQVWQPL